MEEEKNIFEKVKNKLKFSYELGNNPNYELFEKIFKKILWKIIIQIITLKRMILMILKLIQKLKI